MALDKKTFRTRAITAIVFAIVMLIGLFTNFALFTLLITIIQIAAWIEYLNLVEKIYHTIIDKYIKYFFAFCGLVLMLIVGFHTVTTDISILVGASHISLKYLLWLLLLLGCMVFVFQNKQLPNRAKLGIFAGFVYISLSLGLLLYLRESGFIQSNEKRIDIGQLFCIAIIFSIWINDTMAYIVGSLIGKTPFSKISPKKTWEGTAGGAVLCVVAIALLGAFIPAAKEIPVKHWIAIAAISAIFGTLGDLFESKLKRMANVKDSGSFMPGHGGFLDRFDSLLFAAPAVWLYVKLMM